MQVKISLVFGTPSVVGEKDGKFVLLQRNSTNAFKQEAFKLCLTFVKRSVKSGQHSDIFIPAGGQTTTRSNNNLLKENLCNTKRYHNSPLVYLPRVYKQPVRNMK